MFLRKIQSDFFCMVHVYFVYICSVAILKQNNQIMRVFHLDLFAKHQIIRKILVNFLSFLSLGTYNLDVNGLSDGIIVSENQFFVEHNENL